MYALLNKEIERLAQIAETKRIYWGIESALQWATPTSMVVTSAVPGEGKTVLAATLATVAARQSNKRVLLVDLNWYAPAVHRFFGLDLTFDVDAIGRSKSITEFVQRSNLYQLDILTAVQGTHNDADQETDTSIIGAKIIREAREAYDFVVVDTCAVLRMNRYMMDPVNMAKVADGAVLVVLANETPKSRVRRSHILLETAGVNVLGVIVNQWRNPLA